MALDIKKDLDKVESFIHALKPGVVNTSLNKEVSDIMQLAIANAYEDMGQSLKLAALCLDYMKLSNEFAKCASPTYAYLDEMWGLQEQYDAFDKLEQEQESVNSLGFDSDGAEIDTANYTSTSLSPEDMEEVLGHLEDIQNNPTPLVVSTETATEDAELTRLQEQLQYIKESRAEFLLNLTSIVKQQQIKASLFMKQAVDMAGQSIALLDETAKVVELLQEYRQHITSELPQELIDWATNKYHNQGAE